MPEIPTDLSLSAPQARVLGCLLEKQAATPDSYPMTLKALTTACNQSSSRFPVVQYEPTLVEATLHALKAIGLVRFVHPAHGERATKYRHVVDEVLGLDGAQRAVVALLLLRGAQTLAELKNRSERLFEFATTAQVDEVLNHLAAAEPPVVAVVAAQAGQKEPRWIQMLEVDPEKRAASSASSEQAGRSSATAVSIQELQQRVGELEERLESVIEALGDLVEIPRETDPHD